MLLSALLFIPLLGGLLVAFFPKERTREIKSFALIVSLIPLALVLAVWRQLDFSLPGIQLLERAEWIPSLGIT